MEYIFDLIENENLKEFQNFISKKRSNINISKNDMLHILNLMRYCGVTFFIAVVRALPIDYEIIYKFSQKINNDNCSPEIIAHIKYYLLNHFHETRYIGISGKIGSGKTTASLMIMNYIKQHTTKNVHIISFGSNIKTLVAKLFNTSESIQYSQEGKNTRDITTELTYGEIQQKIGTALREYISPDIWVDLLFAKCHPEDNIYIFDDVRFPNEAEAILSRGGILIRLEGDPAGINLNSKRDKTHISEIALDKYDKWTAFIKNDGDFERLKKNIESIDYSGLPPCNHGAAAP